MSELTTLGPLKFIQPKKGYRHGIDSVLLANFVEVGEHDRKALDVGSGDGIISIILKSKYPHLEVVGVEIQEKLFALSCENAKLNDLQIEFIHTNIFYCKKRFSPESFDIVVCNPPYYPVKNGRLAMDKQKNFAKHEVFFNIDSFLKLVKYLLNPKGKLFLIYPYQRFLELIKKVNSENLYIKKLRFIHNTVNEPCNLILFEITKHPYRVALIDKPLIIYKTKAEKIYTDEVRCYLYLERKENEGKSGYSF